MRERNCGLSMRALKGRTRERKGLVRRRAERNTATMRRETIIAASRTCHHAGGRLGDPHCGLHRERAGRGRKGGGRQEG
jgi:hypothetical protein